MMSAVILKTKHSLVGKSLIPLILRMKTQTEPILEANFARLKKDHGLVSYSMSELNNEFEGLTGEQVNDVLPLTGKDGSMYNVRLLVHFAILHANAVGAPRGQILLDSATPSTSSSPSVRDDSATAGASSSVSAQDGKNSSTGGSSSSMEERMKCMEEGLEIIKKGQSTEKVEDALKNVRILAGRPKLTSSSVLIAAMEVLVESATKACHKDAAYFNKTLQACKQYEDNPDFCSLVMKLLGSSEDKKISSTIADWVKVRKHVVSSPQKSKDKTGDHSGGNTASNLVPGAVPIFSGYSGFQPLSPLQNLPYAPYPWPSFGNPYGRPPRPKFQRGSKAVCHFCKQPGHFISSCPKIKKE